MAVVAQFLVNVNRQKIVAENMYIVLSRTVMFGFFVMPFSGNNFLLNAAYIDLRFTFTDATEME